MADLFTSSEGIIKVVQAFETSVTVSNSIQYSVSYNVEFSSHVKFLENSSVFASSKLSRSQVKLKNKSPKNLSAVCRSSPTDDQQLLDNQLTD